MGLLCCYFGFQFHMGQFQICKLPRKRGLKTVFIREGSAGSVNSGRSANIQGSGGGGGVMHAPPVFKNLTNPNLSLHPHVGINGGAGSTSALRVENPSPIFSHGISSMAVVPNGSRSGAQTVKKMRGRPRKYVLDRAGNMSLGLTPVSAATPSSERIFGGESTKEAAA
ncbi:hypothetical protein ABFS82_05G117100 [Erythranthe guttata]